MTAKELRARADEIRAELERLCSMVPPADPEDAAQRSEDIGHADDELAAIMAGLRPELVR